MADVKIRVIGEDKATKQLAGIDGALGKMAKKLGIAALAAKGLKAAFDFTKESTLLAARVDTLGAVTEVMGANAGIAADEVTKLEKAIQAQGITTQASRQALAQMMRAEIDLAMATDLARLAQDAAVISGDNSSQAFEKLTQIIGTGNTFMARRMGLLVDFNGAYIKLADTLGKPVDSLTQLEKVQARTNEVMAQGVTIAGAYDAAMETTGKKLTSLPRHIEELKLAWGDYFEETLGTAIDTTADLLDTLTARIKTEQLLEQAVAKGMITHGKAIKVKMEAWFTDKTYIEVLKELTKEIDINAEGFYTLEEVTAKLDETTERGLINQLDRLIIIEGLTDGTLAYAEAIEYLNGLIEEQTGDTADADVAMISYAANMGLVRDKTRELIDVTGEYNSASQTFEDRARAGAAAMQAMELAAGGAASNIGSMNTAIGNTIDTMIEQIKWFTAGGGIIEAEAAAVMESVRAGDMSGADAELALDALKIAAIDVGLEVGLISTDEAIQEFVDMGDPLVEARAKVAVLQASIFALEGKDIVINIIENRTGSGIYSPKTTTPGPPSPSQGGYEGASGLDFTVPPGYPGDSFGPIWAQSGERVTISPDGKGSGATITNNYYITNMNPETAAMNAAIIQSREMEQLRNNQ